MAITTEMHDATGELTDDPAEAVITEVIAPVGDSGDEMFMLAAPIPAGPAPEPW